MRDNRRNGQISRLKPAGMQKIFDDGLRQLPRAIAGEVRADDGLDSRGRGVKVGHFVVSKTNHVGAREWRANEILPRLRKR